MNTEMNSSTDIRMTDVSVFGRSYEQVHGLGSRPAAERVFGSPGAESAAVPDKKQSVRPKELPFSYKDRSGRRTEILSLQEMRKSGGNAE